MRLALWMTVIIVSFVCGYITAEERSDIYLKPCPQQTGFHQTTSSYSESTGLVCHYSPIHPGYPKRKA